MINKLVQWTLSKVIPYRGIGEFVISNRNWHKCKLEESEQFYGGQDGTGKC